MANDPWGRRDTGHSPRLWDHEHVCVLIPAEPAAEPPVNDHVTGKVPRVTRSSRSGTLTLMHDAFTGRGGEGRGLLGAPLQACD